MQSNSKHHCKQAPLNSVQLLSGIVLSLLLTACSGGISGTGDGGPIIIPPEQSTSDTTISQPQVDGGGSSDGTDAQPPTIPLPDLSVLVPESLLQINARTETLSATAPFAAQFVALQQDANTILNELSSNQLIAAAPDSYFDNVRSRVTDASETVVAWSGVTLYLFRSDANRTLQLLQDSTTVTVRTTDRLSNTVMQANVFRQNDGVIVVESDLNQNGNQSYLQMLTDDDRAFAFLQHPTDRSLAKQREIIDSLGTVLSIQTCTSAMQNCDDDSNWTDTIPQADTNSVALFSSARAQIATAIASSETPFPTLPDGTSEAVFADAIDAEPTERQILCGLQRVDQNIRTFCLRPLPLAPGGKLFSELLAGGEIFYQQLQ